MLVRDIYQGVYVNVCVHQGVTFFALPNCVQLTYLRHLSLMTKIYGLLQLIIICSFT